MINYIRLSDLCVELTVNFRDYYIVKCLITLDQIISGDNNNISCIIFIIIYIDILYFFSMHVYPIANNNVIICRVFEP